MFVDAQMKGMSDTKHKFYCVCVCVCVCVNFPLYHFQI